jgi:NitT/TauT family transport system permease protein
MAAFPANLLFPIAVSGIVVFGLDPNIWLSPLMILNTGCILFNVIAGASAIPSELRYIGQSAHSRLVVVEADWAAAVFPFYVTGAITASGLLEC